jgi:hypothetical protein
MAIRLFYAYSRRDRELRNRLETHLSLLRRQGLIAGWHDRLIGPGAEWRNEIDQNLEESDVILLLVSADFVASDYCYDVEMARAIERHDAGEARVIPILLRPCDWKSASFGRLQALPRNAKAVALWKNRDEAFVQIASELREVIQELGEAIQPTGTDNKRPTTVPLDESSEELGFFDYIAQSEESGAAAIAVMQDINALTSEVGRRSTVRTEQLQELKTQKAVSGVAVQRIAGGMARDLMEYAEQVIEKLPRYQETWRGMRDGVLGAVRSYGGRFGPGRDDLEGLRDAVSGLRPQVSSLERSTREARQALDGNRGISRALNTGISRATGALDRLAAEYAATGEDLIELETRLTETLDRDRPN